MHMAFVLIVIVCNYVAAVPRSFIFGTTSWENERRAITASSQGCLGIWQLAYGVLADGSSAAVWGPAGECE